MSDLISRSKVISVLEQLEEHSLSGKMDISNAIYLLENQPATYDIDKVVEELERFPLGNLGCQELNEIIEIVKQGGVSDDVCKWRFEETNGIVWHCNEKCTTYNQVYIKDLKITLEDFECKCPYCGKKIKVVE